MDPTRATHSPSSSPGLFTPTFAASRSALAAALSDSGPSLHSPYLHPLQMRGPVKETHKAQVEQDFVTGRKLINQYEIIDEIGRGVHGKVKLARNLETGDYVAIKIIHRFSKKRRLGRVTVSPEDKTKREIAILKKIRHPNVVGLLEIIDDPELKKIYMVLEHVELGEVVWRKKGVREICHFERQRVESEARGEDTENDEKFFLLRGRRRQRKEGLLRAKFSQVQSQDHEPWSLEHGHADEDFDNMATLSAALSALSTLSRQSTRESMPRSLPRSYISGSKSTPVSRIHSRAASRAPSRTSSQAVTPMPPDYHASLVDRDGDGQSGSSVPKSLSPSSSALVLEGSMYGSYVDEPPPFRQRAPSTSDSIISHMSSIDGFPPHDAFEDDFSYVPCFTIDQARSTFRDTVLGLEYLHYEGIVHRDIKPANLLWTRDHRVKISDFGVSYFGRPIRDGDNEELVSETDAEDFDDDLELAKTVGTPAFFAPELCYTDADMEHQPKVNEMIDVWSLGVTLYCLIFARIPFMAEDEYQLFRTIATQDVFIPRRRLKPVDPAFSGSEVNLTKRTGPSNNLYREEGEWRMEDIPDDLYDLLERMLQKDPKQRIKLKEVKLHPWVVRGIENVPQWIEETDPSRRAQGRRIQVNEGELERAVVPLTFLERARSVMKKTIGKVIGARSDRGEGSRRRALSSAASSSGDAIHHPHGQGYRDQRRASLRGDEPHMFPREPHLPTEHPLSQSVTVSPQASAAMEDPFAQSFFHQPRSTYSTPLRKHTGYDGSETRPSRQDRSVSNATSINTVIHRTHSHSQSLTMPKKGEMIDEFDDADLASGPTVPGLRSSSSQAHQKLSNRKSDGNLIRDTIQQIDRSTFPRDKRASASLALSTAFGPKSADYHVKPAKLVLSEVNSPADFVLPSPQCASLASAARHLDHSASAPNTVRSSQVTSPCDERPMTSYVSPEPRAPVARGWAPSAVESITRAQEFLDRRRQMELEKLEQDKLHKTHRHNTDPRHAHAGAVEDDTGSLDYETFFRRQRAKERRTESTSSVDSVGFTLPMSYYQSEVASPTSARTLASSQEQSFASDPSLPALVSGASSISADADDFLRYPGFVRVPDSPMVTDDTPATLTPELVPKVSPSSNHDDELEESSISISPGVDIYDEHDDLNSPPAEDYDSDSDEGLTMVRRRHGQSKMAMARRGTNASVGSNETAKKISMTD